MGSGAGIMKFQPGGECCEDPCLIVKDSLDGPDLSTTWTLESGSWNDVAVVTTYTQLTGVVELWHKTPHPDDPYPSDVRLRVRGATGAVLRIILSASGDVASGDALIVELTPGEHCGTLKLYQRLDGVEDLLATLAVYGAIVDEWHDVRACYDPETAILTGSVLPHDETSWRQVSAEVENHTDGEYAGFASGTSDQSDFDTFVYRKLWYDKLITPQCSVLTIEQMPPEIIVPAWTPVTGETWSITMTFDATGTVVGTFTMSYLGVTPAAIVEFDLLTWLAIYSGFTSVSASVTGHSDTGMIFVFTDPLNEYNRVHVVVQREDPLPVVVGTDAYIKDYWYLSVVTEGQKQFQLSYDGQTTSTLSTDTSDATIEAALQSLSTIGSGNILVDGPDGGPWEIYWAGALAETVTWPITVVTNLNDCDPSYSQTERVMCSCCISCCRFDTAHLHDCLVTVVSGAFAEETYTLATGEPVDVDCHRNRGGFRSGGTGEWTTAYSILDVPIHIVADFILYDEPYTSVFRLTFDDGDYIDVWFDGTFVKIQRNSGMVYASAAAVVGNTFLLRLEVCRYKLYTTMTAYSITQYGDSVKVRAQEVSTEWTGGKLGVVVPRESWSSMVVNASSAGTCAKNPCSWCVICEACDAAFSETMILDIGQADFAGTSYALTNTVQDCELFEGKFELLNSGAVAQEHVGLEAVPCRWFGVVLGFVKIPNVWYWKYPSGIGTQVEIDLLIVLNFDGTKFTLRVSLYHYWSYIDIGNPRGYHPGAYPDNAGDSRVPDYPYMIYESEDIDCDNLPDSITLTLTNYGGYPNLYEMTNPLCSGTPPSTVTLYYQ